MVAVGVPIGYGGWMKNTKIYIGEVKNVVKLVVSEYFSCQCYIAIDASEPYLSQIIKFIDSDNLIFGSNDPDIAL
ncbi:MAG: hypothetical protein F6K23_23765 [Okeania sp. SIO2C9]|uniref:hypothetical protein n=1 Tax=Okeania sp. SIO2C9 TaxID=2607791 RepID=UPI0013C06A16|nr:hypothetical protein [Okeania sp. SIO2C9]NEQ75792.1 hypothetical protein [Okeania sp. SIO2C9]